MTDRYRVISLLILELGSLLTNKRALFIIYLFTKGTSPAPIERRFLVHESPLSFKIIKLTLMGIEPNK